MSKILLKIQIANQKPYVTSFKNIIAEIDTGSELSYISSVLANQLYDQFVHWDSQLTPLKGLFSSVTPIGDATVLLMFYTPTYSKLFPTPVFILPKKTIQPNEIILGRDFLVRNNFSILFAPNNQEQVYVSNKILPIEQLRFQ